MPSKSGGIFVLMCRYFGTFRIKFAMPHKIIVNHEKERFEMREDGHVAFIEFQVNDENVIRLTHTLVPSELGGRGIGKKLVESTLAHLKANNQKVIAQCTFVATHLKRHPEWQSIVAE